MADVYEYENNIDIRNEGKDLDVTVTATEFTIRVDENNRGWEHDNKGEMTLTLDQARKLRDFLNKTVKG